MKVWRLARLVYARTSAAAYDGRGAAIAGGRWNPKDVAAAYASPYRALAVLEVLVHIDWTNAPDDDVMAGATIPDDSVETLTALPPKWDGDTPIPACEAIGGSFIAEGRALALVVPSAVSPRDKNVLINHRIRDSVTSSSTSWSRLRLTRGLRRVVSSCRRRRRSDSW